MDVRSGCSILITTVKAKIQAFYSLAMYVKRECKILCGLPPCSDEVKALCYKGVLLLVMEDNEMYFVSMSDPSCIVTAVTEEMEPRGAAICDSSMFVLSGKRILRCGTDGYITTSDRSVRVTDMSARVLDTPGMKYSNVSITSLICQSSDIYGIFAVKDMLFAYMCGGSLQQVDIHNSCLRRIARFPTSDTAITDGLTKIAVLGRKNVQSSDNECSDFTDSADDDLNRTLDTIPYLDIYRLGHCNRNGIVTSLKKVCGLGCKLAKGFRDLKKRLPLDIGFLCMNETHVFIADKNNRMVISVSYAGIVSVVFEHEENKLICGMSCTGDNVVIIIDHIEERTIRLVFL